jgi:hypothetical protein
MAQYKSDNVTPGKSLHEVLVSTFGPQGAEGPRGAESVIVQLVSTSTTCLAGHRYMVVSSEPLIFTLPAAPNIGEELQFFDTTGNSTSSIIFRNGNKVNGLDADLLLDTANFGVGLIYTGPVHGWRSS